MTTCKCRNAACSCAKMLELVRASQEYLRRFFIPQPDGTSPYLERLVLDERPDGSKTYLHVIYASDLDRDPHDHPWPFESRIIWGSYVEKSFSFACLNHGCHDPERGDSDGTCSTCFRPMEMVSSTARYSAGDVNRKRANQLHQLVLDGPVVTLVTRGPEERQWGFQTPQGWMPAPQYIALKFPGAQPVEVD